MPSRERPPPLGAASVSAVPGVSRLADCQPRSEAGCCSAGVNLHLTAVLGDAMPLTTTDDSASWPLGQG